ncbi:hypothetical protein B0J11DRAFT_503065 [Dendryphion nanum]|uniref:Uncharacterized protein n=1 Tax=Dendryphion nanum TaxID=256645 RepID=A0A9P9E5P9_9PLEO|nr:hypothetical protein B0J11DRAFT_503065 [Dendryphion nanum]
MNSQQSSDNEESQLIVTVRCLAKSWFFLAEELNSDKKIIEVEIDTKDRPLMGAGFEACHPDSTVDEVRSNGTALKKQPSHISCAVHTESVNLIKRPKLPEKYEYLRAPLALRGTCIWAVTMLERSIQLIIDKYDPTASLVVRSLIPRPIIELTMEIDREGTRDYAMFHKIFILETSDKIEYAIDPSYAQYGYDESFLFFERLVHEGVKEVLGEMPESFDAVDLEKMFEMYMKNVVREFREQYGLEAVW